MLKKPTTLPMHHPDIARLQLNMKAVSGLETPFSAVLAFRGVLSGFRYSTAFSAVIAPIKKTAGGGSCRPVDLSIMDYSKINIPLSPVPPSVKIAAAAKDKAKRRLDWPQALKKSGGQHE